jgi:glycosyltransferase involved in cell wall biosynthesis
MPIHQTESYPAMPTPTTCSVVVPVYNSEQTLEPLIQRLQAVLTSLFLHYEIILVNDGSHDNSWNVIEGLVEQYDHIQAVNLMRNFGQHNALLCGIRQARHEVIVTIDDDLQNPPEEIVNLLTEFNKGYDVVYGTPNEGQHGFFRNAASRITKIALQSSMGVDVATKVSAFRIFRTQLREAFASYNGLYVSIDVLLTWGTTRFSAVTVRLDSREFGVSNYTLMKLIRHALNMITGFSILPLQFASITGFVFMAFGVIVFLYVIGRVILEGGSVPGFPFLASIIAIFSGVQLFALGIIGEYLARMHVRLLDRPSYAVRNTTESIHHD